MQKSIDVNFDLASGELGASGDDSNGEPTGIVIVDHGSKRAESNQMLERFVDFYRAHSRHPVVEPAHMELAEPSIATAFDRCVAQGCNRVVVCPYFLLPGKHWYHDIPALTAAAAQHHPGVSYLVTAPIGLHPLMTQVISSRIDHCLQHAAGSAGPCDACEGITGCQLKTALSPETSP